MELGLSIVSTAQVLREEITELKKAGGTVALVPTMGALHEGHLSLVKLGLELADSVVCSIFVNPKQFGENEDLDAYPRTLAADIQALSSVNTDIVFTPETDEMYPEGYQTMVSIGDISSGLCGASRPGHFDGMATIVCKLLLMAGADVAIFGEKDYQQLLVIKRMAEDLHIPTKIIGAPILRADDGLALSSRNQYLSAKDRDLAPLVYKILVDTKDALLDGSEIEATLLNGQKTLKANGFEMDYFELRDTVFLQPLTGELNQRPARLLVAAKLGNTRLIDNIEV